MPYALVVIGLIMIVTAVLNTYAAFGAQVVADFTGPKSFIVWILALGSVGALGYINDFRQFSHYFMALILISMILSNRGFFAKLQEALASGPVAPTAQPTSTDNFLKSTVGTPAANNSDVQAQTKANAPKGAQSFGDFIGSLFAPSPAY